MAFQQPQQRPQPQQLRPIISHTRQPSDQQQQQQQPQQQQQQQTPTSPSASRKRTLDESQEWILFSPAPRDSQSHTSETPRTATHLSDFGSLQTHVRSQAEDKSGGAGNAASPIGVAEGEAIDDSHSNGNEEEEQAELDSLDDGLHAFHHHPFSASSDHYHNGLDQSGGAVLPRHDGFGTFPSSAGLQEQLWAFERYNPHRRRPGHHLRRSSVQRQLDAMEVEEGVDVEDERTARIERWRLDQSRVVLEEIEKETKRRKRRMSRMGAEVSMETSVHTGRSEAQSRQGSGTSIQEQQQAQQPSESFWQRITRKVIQDLIGLDDTTLSVILGQSLAPDPSPTPRQTSPIAAAASRESRVTFGDPSYSWEAKLLDRIARELGVLVSQLSGGHEGAFTTYMRTQEELDYAGLGRSIGTQRDLPPRQPSLRSQRRRQQQQQQQQQSTNSIHSHHDPMFSPTLMPAPPLASPSDAPDSSLWGIEEEPAQDTDANVSAAEAEREAREYWEREIDVKLIFSYLRDRFSSVLLRNSNTDNPQIPTLDNNTPQPSDLNTTNPLLPTSWATPTPTTARTPTHDSHLRRAELIRRQHPLISRSHRHHQQQQREQQQRRQLHHEALLRSRQPHHHHLGVLAGTASRRTSSSCASQSTRRSRALGSRSGSSRHFWDFPAAGGTGQGSGGSGGGSGLGGWGEV